MRAPLCGLLLLLATAAASAAVPASFYSPPGGLTAAQAPQFVLLSHDDAIAVTTNAAVRAVVNQFKNPGGCNVPFTFFTSGGSGSNCATVQRLLADNHEIATHTFSHAALLPASVNVTDEIKKQIDWLITNCGIAREKLTSFRAPYLLHNPEMRAALVALGVKTDSSIIESWPSATSPSYNSRLWPYSMSNGIIQDCQWMAPSTCSASEKYPLFEVPLQQFLVGPVTNGKAVALSSMDPTDTTADALAAQMMTQFNYSYNGNRAPMEIAVHTPWFTSNPDHATALTSFVKQALALPNVYFVTYEQLRQWTAAPVPASQMQSWLKCNAVNFTAEERAPCTTYTVKSGDSVWSIAAAEGVEVDELTALNPSLNTSNGAIYLGQRLRLPPWTDTCSDSLAGQEPCRNHTVAAGEGLYSIALAYTLTVDDLLSVNTGVTTTSALQIGQVLRIPPWPVVECRYGNYSQPATSPSPSPAPGDVVSDSCGTETVDLDLVLTGFSTATWDAHAPQFSAALSSLVRVTANCIVLTRTTDVAIVSTAGQRRLLAQRSLLQDSQLLVQATIYSLNATQISEYLRAAQQLGTLNLMLSTLGAASVDNTKWAGYAANGALIAAASSTSTTPTPASPSPVASPSPAVSPSPAPTTTDTASAGTTSSKSNKHLGAIIGGAVGGGVGAIIAAAVLVFLIKRRSAGDSGSGGLRATWNPTYSGATATVATGAGPTKFELEQVVEASGTPRSARRRQGGATAFNG
ncbi:hypothetical protein C2E21_5091 [Chlorella sorokiniana]|uniref:LysM domain-containing protein n=1 Tax=Chlorella sorokiniana TaxID=3076 RepID=A0A2P6TPJ8_CHLSO|nr:hypothetical protein C2E21_5091 [Chlorella sorokiniana]|eukprot:PRW55955.1 hypothetical protein C2E21_5091 [Chlorella sorokiniana]